MKKKAAWAVMLLMALSAAGPGQEAVSKADILSTPGWRQIYDDFVPDPALIEIVKQALLGRRATVVFGSWCDDSKNNVPLFLKIVDALAVPEFEVVYLAVEKKSVDGQKYYLEGLRVEKVPTFIFFIGENEIGRIIENPRESILQDMLQIVL